MNKKKLLSLALAVIMLAILSFGTLAWFSDDDSVENKFYIASSDDTSPEDIFSVDVWENTPDGDKEQTGHEYKDILPGATLKKEVYVENTGHYDQYIRVTVTISDAKAWINAMGANFDVTKVFDGFVIDDWTHIWNNLYGATEIPKDIVYVMYYKDILPSGEKINVFDNVVIPDTLTQEQAAVFEGDFTIDVKADAVQTANVVPEGTQAGDAAWIAFKTVEGN